MNARDALRAIRCDLFAHREMQTHVQERILPPAFRGELGCKGLFAGLEPLHVLRVFGNDGSDLASSGSRERAR